MGLALGSMTVTLSGALTSEPEATVMHAHPAAGPAVNSSRIGVVVGCGSLIVTAELFENQLAFWVMSS